VEIVNPVFIGNGIQSSVKKATPLLPRSWRIHPHPRIKYVAGYNLLLPIFMRDRLSREKREMKKYLMARGGLIKRLFSDIPSKLSIPLRNTKATSLLNY